MIEKCRRCTFWKFNTIGNVSLTKIPSMGTEYKGTNYACGFGITFSALSWGDRFLCLYVKSWSSTWWDQLFNWNIIFFLLLSSCYCDFIAKIALHNFMKGQFDWWIDKKYLLFKLFVLWVKLLTQLLAHKLFWTIDHTEISHGISVTFWREMIFLLLLLRTIIVLGCNFSIEISSKKRSIILTIFIIFNYFL